MGCFLDIRFHNAMRQLAVSLEVMDLNFPLMNPVI